jgi:hypothetical protein
MAAEIKLKMAMTTTVKRMINLRRLMMRQYSGGSGRI